MTRELRAFCLTVIVVGLALLAIQAFGEPYKRKLYGSGWKDADHDCQNTRTEVLIEESQVPVTLSEDGCEVEAGEWLDPYSGLTFTDPGDLDVDHMIPLAYIHEQCGYRWDAKKREAYANFLDDPNHLVAVDAGLNRSKGQKGPSRWIPKESASHCWYGTAWRNIAERWECSLKLDDWLATYALIGGACE